LKLVKRSLELNEGGILEWHDDPNLERVPQEREWRKKVRENDGKKDSIDVRVVDLVSLRQRTFVT